jgi:hypothetical protein
MLYYIFQLNIAEFSVLLNVRTRDILVPYTKTFKRALESDMNKKVGSLTSKTVMCLSEHGQRVSVCVLKNGKYYETVLCLLKCVLSLMKYSTQCCLYQIALNGSLCWCLSFITNLNFMICYLAAYRIYTNALLSV